MTDPRDDRDTSMPRTDSGELVVRYPENNVLAIFDTREQLATVLRRLSSSGFISSEISIASGEEDADALKESTGRGGFTGLVIRVANRLGMQNDEGETKDQYEQALRDHHYVVAVLAPTDARKELASQLLVSSGGRFINFLGHLSIERIRG